MDDYREQLVALAEQFSHARKLSEARVANLAGCDSRFFLRMRARKTCSVDTFNRLLQWFSDGWPTDLSWPAEVARPPQTELQTAEAADPPREAAATERSAA